MRLDRRSCSPLQVTVSQPTLRTLRLTLDGELDATSRPLLQDVAGAVTLASPGDVEVDAAGLSFVDLRGLRALGDLWARLERAGRVTLVRSSRAVERLLLACVRAGLPVPLPSAARRPSLPGVDPSSLPPAPATPPSGASALLLSDGPPLLAPTGTQVGGLATPPAEGHGRYALASLDLLGLGPVPGADMQVTERPEASAIDPSSTEAEAPSDADPSAGAASLASLDLLGLATAADRVAAEPRAGRLSSGTPSASSTRDRRGRVAPDHPSVRAPRPKLRRRIALDHPALLPPLDDVMGRSDWSAPVGPSLPGGRIHRSEAVRSRCRHGH